MRLYTPFRWLPFHPFLVMKSFMPRQFFARTLLILFLPMLMVQLVLMYVFLDRHLDSVTRLLASNITRNISTLIQQQERGFFEWEEVTSYAERYFHLNASYMHGTPSYTQSQDLGWVENYLADEMKERLPYPHVLHTDDNLLDITLVLKGGFLKIQLPRKELFSRSTPLVILWALGTTILFSLIAVLFLRKQVQPLQNLALAADAFGKGRDIPLPKSTGAREVRQLATAFLLMKERIHVQMTQRLRMLAGISHDLKTPLTRMRLQLAMLHIPAPAQKALEEDIADMEKMVQGYLEFLRGQEAEQASEIPLPAFLFPFTKATKLSLEIKGDNVTLWARPHALSRALQNILENAQKYGALKMLVTVHSLLDGIEITLEDDGPGIPPAQYDNALKPFVRLDPARNPDTGGSGLGLNIVQDIMLTHGGQIALGESSLGGLKISLFFPS